MSPTNENAVGLTKDTGWQVGARRMYPVALEEAWQLVVSSEGTRIWLGEVTDPNWVEGAGYELSDGTSGEIRIFKPNSHLRITYFPPGWPRSSTIQVRVISGGPKTQISFHQEHLSDAQARAERKEFFLEAHQQLAELVRANRGSHGLD